MALTDVNVGTAADNGTGETLRSGGQTINSNFALVVEGPSGGSSTDGGLVLWDGTNGRLVQDGARPEQVTAFTTVTGTTYSLNASDAGSLVRTTNGSAVTITVPTNASVAYPARTVISIVQYGAGQVTIQGASGVTINSRNGVNATIDQYSGATLIRIAADEWWLFGELE